MTRRVVRREGDRLVYQDETGLLDLPLPALIGAHQIQNAGIAIAALRALQMPEPAYDAAMTGAAWPARMQRLRTGPLVEAAQDCEIWLDGGHNPAAGQAIARTLGSLPKRDTHLVCGMLNTKDVTGFMQPLVQIAHSLTAISIPDAPATLTATETAENARKAGFTATEAPDAQSAVKPLAPEHPGCRILICGSLYLAGHVLRINEA